MDYARSTLGGSRPPSRALGAGLVACLMALGSLSGPALARNAPALQAERTSDGKNNADLVLIASDPAALVRAFAETCLVNYRTPDEALPALEGLGLTLTAGMDEGSWEVSGPGVMGIVSTVPEIYCSIQSTEVNLDNARNIGTSLAERLFPGMIQMGAPEGGNGPCDGLSIFAPRQLIWIRYAQAGNSGECIDDGTSAIIIQ
ncbi:hypothetical protein [Maritimibacter sp. DP1N21-5]|uniref:hypothetical protein n=1 Tax=Maritimibacter sp. DP1N21-5 TaxID=2836867 RepID=UPI001C46AEA4|nr:hypothetical protein [Maritimibacter sp. DP1N21-5]MBV7410323.1 hypothetical protein [Maritimibacter sp. DP1N21-5]